MFEKSKSSKKSGKKTKFQVKRWQQVENEDQLETGEYQALGGVLTNSAIPQEIISPGVSSTRPTNFLRESAGKKRNISSSEVIQNQDKKVMFELKYDALTLEKRPLPSTIINFKWQLIIDSSQTPASCKSKMLKDRRPQNYTRTSLL